MNSPPRPVIKPAAVFKRAAKIAIIFAVALSLGLHWVVLQSVAWAGMFATYAQQSTVRAAFVKTFNGKNPCRICKLVREGQQSEQEKASVLPLVKIESVPGAVGFVLLPPIPAVGLPALDQLGPQRTSSPPSPPPKAA